MRYSYNCQYCGSRVRNSSSVKKCINCQITLCYGCYRKGFCPKCDQYLLPEEKSKLRKGAMSSAIGCGACCGVVIGVGGLTYLLGMFIPVIFYAANLVFGLSIVVGIGLICSFYKRGKNQISETREEIKYRLLGGSQPSTVPSSTVDAFCGKCGNKLQGNQKFCTNCGEKL